MIQELRSTIFACWKKGTDRVGRYILHKLNSSRDFAVENSEPHRKAESKAEDDFLEVFAKRTWRYLILVGVVLSATALLDVSVCGELPDQSYGLAVDLTGAVILGRGLVKGSIPIANESTEGFDYDPVLVESLAKDSVDGIWGIFFILVGIGLQVIAVTFPHLSLPITAQFFC